MKPNLRIQLTLGLLLAGLPLAASAQHGHLNAGATGQNQGDPLIFANGNAFIESSGYVKTLTFTDTGTYAGYFQGSITPTALYNATDAGSPAPGSFIRMEIQSVTGPAGGTFAYWEHGAASPTHQINSGATAPFRFDLSESDGSPGSDPGGHIHGRRFTATHPGIYTVLFRLFDTSTNGAGAGPIHTPSTPLAVRFQAGVNLESVTPRENDVQVKIGAQAGRTLQVEKSHQLGAAADWQPVGAPIAGNDHIQSVSDPSPNPASGFYRVKDVTPQP
ncbi:MAG TPA: hypothetical protein DCY13_05150 [Verrucomicrobiales bacterium]|nr:hypothetical protein [Verrucomicrobiales bacterium]